MKNRKFSETQFREAVAKSKSIHQTLINLGLCAEGGAYRAFHNAQKEFNCDTSHFTGQGWNKGFTFEPKKPLSAYLNNEFSINSYRLKSRLIKEGIFISKCAICSSTEWLGKAIPLELDHIDGNHENNNLKNLRLVCPNCHAQTPNHAGKNKGKGKYS